MMENGMENDDALEVEHENARPSWQRMDVDADARRRPRSSMACAVPVVAVILLGMGTARLFWHGASPTTPEMHWRTLPSLPQGLAGAFAGVSGGALIVAGGTNFLDGAPWDGGTKSWFSAVYALSSPQDDWKRVGDLPRALGYGVSATWRGKVLCVGGSDSSTHRSETFALRFRAADNMMRLESGPDLPIGLANAAGVLVGDVLYVAGGSTSPLAQSALASLWALDLSEGLGLSGLHAGRYVRGCRYEAVGTRLC